jgi:hypothetical protein
MLTELESASSVVSLRLSRKRLSQGEANLLLAVAATSIPGEVRAKYLREQGISIVQADVRVDAVGAASLELHAVVHVESTYEGDMVRSSPVTRRKIGDRLQELAQQHCAEAVLKELTGD